MAPPPSLADYLSSHLVASVPGQHRYAVQILRSDPQRSHALFPHATNAKHVKVWHEETLVVLSERRQVPLEPGASSTATASGAGGAAVGASATADPSLSTSGAPVASTSTAAPPPPASHEPVPPTATTPTREALVPIAALEASLYFVPSSSCALLYISKVDTTGLSSSPISPTRALVSAFVAHHLAHPPHGATRLRVHVFARAQSQYLFPGSADNKQTKRVLDDKQLLRWWKATLERASIMATHGNGNGDDKAGESIRKWYLVPGLAHLESLPYVPATAPGWTYGNPYSSLSSPLHPASDPPSAHPLPDHVPAFADDPKSRFLHSLTSSPVAASGTAGDYDDAWRALGSATFSAGAAPLQKVGELERQVERERARLVQGVPGGVDEWWERMAFRQECCAGQLVGFFVVAVGEPAPSSSSSPSSAPAVAPPAAPPSPTHSTTSSSRSHTHAPKRHALALRPAQYTKHWSTLHNFDYALPALGRLAGAVEHWSEGVEKAVRSTARDEGELARAAGEGAAGEGREGEDEERAWRASYEREVAREVRVDNSLPAVGGQSTAGEKRPAEGAPGGGAGAGGAAGAAGEAPKVNVLAPRKKKKKVEGAA
ncbi:hypothetical protein JCM8208_007622 [Rhodotorula glutinis]